MFKFLKEKNSIKDIPTPELEIELLSRYGDIFEYTIDKQEEKIIMKELKKINGLLNYLKATQAKDVTRYFSAQDEKQRDLIRGAFHRTLYLYRLIQMEGDTKIGKRYSK